MGQRHLEKNDEPTIDCAARRLGVDAVVDVARAAFDHAGELATLECGHTAAVLGAVRLAARRTGVGEPAPERFAESFDVDPERVAVADEVLATYLSPPADRDEIRSLRRTLVVAREVRAAVERGRNAGPELPARTSLTPRPSCSLARAATSIPAPTASTRGSRRRRFATTSSASKPTSNWLGSGRNCTRWSPRTEPPGVSPADARARYRGSPPSSMSLCRNAR